MANKRDKHQQKPHQQQSDMGKGTFDKGANPEHEEDLDGKQAGREDDLDVEKDLDRRE